MIPFNKAYLAGKEINYISECLKSGMTSGDGPFTKKCHSFFEKKYGFKKVLLTTSCTDALEMAAILLNIKEGDEVIVPSYTFVSTANAFALRGAKIVFADSMPDHPNIDVSKIEPLITERTRVIVPVHYAGIACDMDEIMRIAKKYDLFVVEDSAQAIDSYYKDRPLGSIGHLATFSFHVTKNIISGEGGMLAINDQRFIERAEIIREKGTNRGKFFRGEVDKYGWVDIGSSFLPSDVTAAYLLAQLEELERIQQKRKSLWSCYKQGLNVLKEKGMMDVMEIPPSATNNGHMFYVICKNLAERSELIQHLKENGIASVFHYLSLHKSSFYEKRHTGGELPNADHFTDCLLRLPFYYDMTEETVSKVCDTIKSKYL
jgi:dTDP-4-amino-4,6-dideoxygalactose transaminase